MIGVFDSGVGGLTVVRELKKQLPEYNLVYFGDTARTPYGNKSKETIIKYALEDADFLIRKGAKILVVACNTASAVAFDALKEKHPNIPIFEVITPAVKDACEATKNNRIGVIGTRATIGSGIYEEKLLFSCHSRPHHCHCEERTRDAAIPPSLCHSREGGNPVLKVFSQPCPLFVPFIEEGWIKKIELKMIARRYLSSLKSHNIDTLILGCTHYPIIKDIIQKKIGERVKLIDSAEAVSEKIKDFLQNNSLELSKNSKLDIFVSDKTTQCQSIANKVLGSAITIYEDNNIK